ncbi:MAG: N-acetyltransferase [Proteobacteria bacterium]|nr:N-acetyltransferase [Pseudomonadota bacterium]
MPFERSPCPVGVLPSQQGKGIGSALIREALAQLRSSGAAGVVLVGDPGFYKRFGFKNLDALSWGHVPAEYVLALPFKGEAPAGEINPHRAFSQDQPSGEPLEEC